MLSAITIPKSHNLLAHPFYSMILDILRHGNNSITFAALTALRQQWPDRFILESPDHLFRWEEFAFKDNCTFQPRNDDLSQAITQWSITRNRLERSYLNGYFDVQWNGQTLQLMQIHTETDCGPKTHHWIVTNQEQLAREFFEAVCRWNSQLREEVYVFQEGYWHKDSELFHSIQSSRLSNLILPPGLKESIRNDAATFFESRERYRQFNIPWKRGLILIGPPGNGKTHMIQALINDLNQPCLYLKSLKARYHNEDYSIRQVFEKARESAPCILVMEDLDALIDDENRSFFLNELDGFRKNEGILAIATTNHPEKLDPAIVDRPSRFDRKYHFDLPAVPERAAYLTWWNQQLQPATRLTESGITSVARDSEGFSFAYLKELALSSIMAWMNESHRPMDVVMAQQVVNLRQQMVSVKPPVMVSPIER
jgi:hypothetical protein